MSGSLKIYPPAEGATMRVHLRDEGQDFLWLDIGRATIVGAGPFQGWLWRGKKTRPNQIEVGKLVPVELTGGWSTLKYPVTRIQKLAA
jgi:hypothetical protein